MQSSTIFVTCLYSAWVQILELLIASQLIVLWTDHACTLCLELLRLLLYFVPYYTRFVLLVSRNPTTSRRTSQENSASFLLKLLIGCNRCKGSTVSARPLRSLSITHAMRVMPNSARPVHTMFTADIPYRRERHAVWKPTSLNWPTLSSRITQLEFCGGTSLGAQNWVRPHTMSANK